MDTSTFDRDLVVCKIAGILAGAYLRLRVPAALHLPSSVVDCPETQSESCDGRLTA